MTDIRPSAAAEGPARPLPEFSPPSGEAQALFDHDSLFDLDLAVEVPLGVVLLTLGQLLSLRPGAVLTLERRTGEPLEITVNGTTVATGDVRVHGERFAIRVTEILGAPRRDDVVGEEVPRADAAVP